MNTERRPAALQAIVNASVVEHVGVAHPYGVGFGYWFDEETH